MQTHARTRRATLVGLLILSLLASVQTSPAQIVNKLARSGKKSAPARAAAATGKVAIYSDDIPSRITDVQSKLTATGLFTQVDAFALDNEGSGCGGSASLQTLQQLQQYDAVLVWMNCGSFYFDQATMGDALADYLDAGGGVVLAAFSFEGFQAPSGRLAMGDYLPLTFATATSGHQTLVKDLPAHPILQGVNSFDGGTSSYRHPVSLTPGAQQIAHWTDNTPLVATKQKTAGRVVGLNFYPVSDSVDPSFWVATTDGARLMANALLFADQQTGAATSPTPGQIIISEFRTNGPGGTKDEFVELYNATDSDITIYVNSSFGNSNGLLVTPVQPGGCTLDYFLGVPNGTFIPARGHYLITNNQYSLSTLAPSDRDPFSATGYDMADNTAIILQKADGATRTILDAVGFSPSTCGGTFIEGTPLTPISTSPGASDQYSFLRKLNSGVPQDTGDNANDFVLVSPTGAVGTTTATLGAAGPENTLSPVQRNATIKAALIDSGCTTNTVGSNTAPVTTTCPRVRDVTPGTGATADGTLSIRRTFINHTGASVTRLRFRVVDITTLNSPGYGTGGQADVRALSSSDMTAACVGTGVGCPSVGATVTIRGTTLETPPAQSSGGGVNSTLSAGAITLTAPLSPGDSVNIQFLLGVAQTGSFRFFVNVEALP